MDFSLSGNNSSRIQNVIFLVIDCLSTSFLKKGGNSLDICPVINSLADNGIVCVNARSHSWATQLSCPSIFTSTLPLDYGGYDFGILKRPLSIAEALKDNGFYTVGFTPNPWGGEFYGYDRGFDEFYELFDVSKFWIIFSDIYHRYYVTLFKQGILSRQNYCRIMGDLFDKFLQELLRRCNQISHDLNAKRCRYDFSIHRHDFTLYQSILKSIQTEFQKNKTQYILAHLSDDISNKFRFFLTGQNEESDRKDLLASFLRIPSSLLKRLGVQIRRYRHTVSTDYLRKEVNSAIGRFSQKPFFIWTHLFEIHDNISIPGRFGWPEDFVTLGFQRMLDYKNPIKSVNRIFALRLIDKQIAEIIKKLKSENLFEKTLIVICGDHGFTAKHTEENLGSLSEENTRVPIIFFNPNMKNRIITEPCGLQDVAPTILSLIGAKPRPEFHGQSLIEKPSPDRPVILESLCPGPGDFSFKAVNIAVIRGKNKLIWYEPGYENTCKKRQNSFFDLENDPKESVNLYGNEKYKKEICELETIATERCNLLRQKTSEPIQLS
ncbi:MAG: sulfatase-like hydrolase/transferase [Phycisphaerae bacterium]